jgi:hypothetical protein
MKKIFTAILHTYRSDAHCEFMVVFRKLLQKFPDAIAAIAAWFQTFIDLLALEERLVNLMHKSDYCVVEPIDTQKYTEKAVVPIPKAYWRGNEKHATVELVFAKDFSLTYKNNIKIGTAEVTLHGKGAYKGQKTATFNIAS